MRSDYLPSDLKQLWKELASNPVQVSPDDLRRETRKLRSGVLLRNWFATAVCCFAIAAYGMFAFRSTTNLERIGAVLAIAGGINVIVQYLRRPVRSMPEFGANESIRFYRAELERHRDFHRIRGIGAWLLPLLPGPILFNVAFAVDHPKFASIIELQMLVFLMLAALVFPLNLRMARRYQRRLDALNASQGDQQS